MCARARGVCKLTEGQKLWTWVCCIKVALDLINFVILELIVRGRMLDGAKLKHTSRRQTEREIRGQT